METATTTTTPHQILVAGTWVRAKDTGREHYDGKIGRIDEAQDAELFRVIFLNQLTDMGEQRLYLTREKLEALENPGAAESEQILEAWKSRFEFQRNRANTFDREFERLCETITSVAEDAGYCDEYDKVVEEVNASMSRNGYSLSLPRREREYEVNVTMTSSITVTTTVSVTAASEEEACDYVTDDPESYMDVNDLFLDEIRYNGVDCDDVSADVR